MLVRARAWGFIRASSLNGRYGVLAGEEAAEGDFASILAGTYELPADAGVELCPVPETLPLQGDFALYTDGSYIHGPITGSDPWTCRLYYYRPGDATDSEAAGSPATIYDEGGSSSSDSGTDTIATLQGVAASPAVGAVQASGGTTGELAGAAAAPAVGSVGAAGDAVAAFLGVAAVPGVGQIRIVLAGDFVLPVAERLYTFPAQSRRYDFPQESRLYEVKP